MSFCYSHDGCCRYSKNTIQSLTPTYFCWIHHQIAKMISKNYPAVISISLKKRSTCLLPTLHTFPHHHPPKEKQSCHKIVLRLQLSNHEAIHLEMNVSGFLPTSYQFSHMGAANCFSLPHLVCHIPPPAVSDPEIN